MKGRNYKSMAEENNFANPSENQSSTIPKIHKAQPSSKLSDEVPQINMKNFLPPLQKRNQGIDEIEVRRGVLKVRDFAFFFRRTFIASKNKACEFFIRPGFICTDDAVDVIVRMGMNPEAFAYIRFCGNIYPVGIDAPYKEVVIFSKSIWFRTDAKKETSPNMMLQMDCAKTVIPYGIKKMSSDDRADFETLTPLIDDLQRIQTEYDELREKGFFRVYKDIWDETPQKTYSFEYTLKSKKTKLKFYLMKTEGIKGTTDEFLYPPADIPQRKVEIEMDENPLKKKLIKICFETFARALFNSYVPAYTLNYELGDYFSFNHLLELPSDGETLVNPFWGVLITKKKISKKEAFAQGLKPYDLYETIPKKMIVKKTVKKKDIAYNNKYSAISPSKPMLHVSNEILSDMFSD